jgi:hypothetical protein
MGFFKNWGMAACVNVIFHSMGWGGHHMHKIEENF